ncbi:hypothetical protein RRG08_012116 [Elysia crispata]|uniref:Uncharacterized protein n=1 Tax=Elysia crispata TaxID=231223 RepID=A0AAE0ZQU5_9GAST|nr:hypothetical protein RRG08_012116 [Elysia crispata]
MELILLRKNIVYFVILRSKYRNREESRESGTPKLPGTDSSMVSKELGIDEVHNPPNTPLETGKLSVINK